MRSYVSRWLKSLKRSTEDVVTDSRSEILVAVGAGWFLSLGVRMVYPVLLPHLRAAYGLNLTTAGLLLTLLWGAYAIGQLPAGFFTDQVGERLTLTVSSFLSAMMLIVVINANSAIAVFAATGLFGFGTALYGVARFTAISRLFPENDGTAIGITLAAGDFGNAVLPATAGTIAAVFAWQFSLGITVPLFVVVGCYLWHTIPANDTGDSSTSFSSDTARYVLAELRSPPIVIVTIILIFGFSLWQAFTGFYPTYLIEEKDFSPTIATGLFSFYFMLGIGIHPLSGAVYDRFGIRVALPAFFGVTMGALVLLPLIEGFWPLVAVTILLSSMLGNIAITMPYLTASLPDNIQGTGLGVLRSTYMLIGAASPTFFGLLAQRGFFDEGFIILGGMAGVMIILALRLPVSDDESDIQQNGSEK